MFSDKSWEECKLLISEKIKSIEKRLELLESDSSVNKTGLTVLQNDVNDLQKQIEKIFNTVDNIKVDTTVNKTKLAVYIVVASTGILLLLGPLMKGFIDFIFGLI